MTQHQIVEYIRLSAVLARDAIECRRQRLVLRTAGGADQDRLVHGPHAIGGADASLAARAVDWPPNRSHYQSQPMSIRTRAATVALPFEVPKLSAVAVMNGDDFGSRMDAAIARSRGGMKVIERRADEVVEEHPRDELMK